MDGWMNLASPTIDRAINRAGRFGPIHMERKAEGLLLHGMGAPRGASVVYTYILMV